MDALGDFGTDVSAAISEVAGADWEGFGRATAILGGAVFRGIVDFAIGSFNAAGKMFRAFGSGVRFVVDAVGLAVDGDFGGALRKLAQGLINFAFALMQIPVGILDGFTSIIEDITGLDLASISDDLEALRQSVNKVFDDIDENAQISAINFADFIVFADNGQVQAGLLDVVDTFNAEMADTFGSAEQDRQTGVPVDIAITPNLEWNEATIQDFQGLLQLQADAAKAGNSGGVQFASAMITSIEQTMYKRGIEIPEEAYQYGAGVVPTMEIAPEITSVKVGRTALDMSGAAPLTMTESFEPLTLDTALTAVPSEPLNLSGVSLNFFDSFAEGATADTIITEQLLPIETKWNEMFGEGSVMALAMTTFKDGTVASWGEVEQAATKTITALIVQTPLAIAAVLAMTTVSVGALKQLYGELMKDFDAVQKLYGAIRGLLNLEGTLSVQVDIQHSGAGMAQGGTVPSHAEGLGYVPYDNYLAFLHKGERVLTAEENKNLSIPTNVLVGNPRSSGGNVTTNEVHLHGVQDVDKFLFELRRRGIDITK
jgi:hypothetical protein